MAARAGQRRPQQDRVHSCTFVEFCRLERAPLAIKQWLLTAEFRIPYSELPLEIAEAGGDGEVDTVLRGRLAQGANRLGGIGVQPAPELGNVADVGGCAARQLLS